MIVSDSRDIKTKLEASIAGAVAARILSRSSHARITHVFDKSFYAEVGDQLICVLAEDFLNGPINICVNEIPRNLDEGTCIEISSTKAEIWEPIKFGPINADRLFENLPETYRKDLIEAKSLLPKSLSSPLFKTIAQPALIDLCLFLRDKKTAPGPAIKSLLGLGPGLTPSGDDFLIGMMLVLHTVGEKDLFLKLAKIVRDLAPPQTSSISNAHLSAMTDSAQANRLLHELLFALQEKKSIKQALIRAENFGHSSGKDAIAGIITALFALRQRHPPLNRKIML
ncbi:MAG: DUF2877 domain-containing protein [Pseudomonadota bacterium]|nr:DUF2877 domain-containing protein [Pseudomonadota bacterium]